MGSKVVGLIGFLLLALGTLCGPGLWLLFIACSFTAWLPGLEDAVRLELLWAGFVSACWALWGLTSGLQRLPRVFLGAGSLLNMLVGFLIFVSGEQYCRPIGALFLGYSMAQLIACRRPMTHIVS